MVDRYRMLFERLETPIQEGSESFTIGDRKYLVIGGKNLPSSELELTIEYAKVMLESGKHNSLTIDLRD
jgi:hypothetical protein